MARKDKHLKTNILLIEYVPKDAVNFNELMRYCNSNYDAEHNRYYNEQEIVSRLIYNTIESLYFLKSYRDIPQYKSKGIKIQKEDYKLSIKNIYKKYKLAI